MPQPNNKTKQSKKMKSSWEVELSKVFKNAFTVKPGYTLRSMHPSLAYLSSDPSSMSPLPAFFCIAECGSCSTLFPDTWPYGVWPDSACGKQGWIRQIKRRTGRSQGIYCLYFFLRWIFTDNFVSSIFQFLSSNFLFWH